MLVIHEGVSLTVPPRGISLCNENKCPGLNSLKGSQQYTRIPCYAKMFKQPNDWSEDLGERKLPKKLQKTRCSADAAESAIKVDL